MFEKSLAILLSLFASVRVNTYHSAFWKASYNQWTVWIFCAVSKRKANALQCGMIESSELFLAYLPVACWGFRWCLLCWGKELCTSFLHSRRQWVLLRAWKYDSSRQSWYCHSDASENASGYVLSADLCQALERERCVFRCLWRSWHSFRTFVPWVVFWCFQGSGHDKSVPRRCGRRTVPLVWSPDCHHTWVRRVDSPYSWASWKTAPMLRSSLSWWGCNREDRVSCNPCRRGTVSSSCSLSPLRTSHRQQGRHKSVFCCNSHALLGCYWGELSIHQLFFETQYECKHELCEQAYECLCPLSEGWEKTLHLYDDDQCWIVHCNLGSEID